MCIEMCSAHRCRQPRWRRRQHHPIYDDDLLFIYFFLLFSFVNNYRLINGNSLAFLIENKNKMVFLRAVCVCVSCRVASLFPSTSLHASCFHLFEFIFFNICISSVRSFVRRLDSLGLLCDCVRVVRCANVCMTLKRTGMIGDLGLGGSEY